MDFFNNTTVQEDPGRTPYPKDPEYLDADVDGVINDATDAAGTPTEYAVPVAYVRDTKVRVSAEFKVTAWGEMFGVSGSKDVFARTSMGAFSITPETDILGNLVPNATLEGNIVRLPATNADGPLQPHVIRTGGVIWQIGIEATLGQITWTDAGYCPNTIYATLDNPIPPVYHTLLELSTAPSWGATTQGEVVTETYESFKTKQVHAVQPAFNPAGTPSADKYGSSAKPLYYYLNWDTGYTKTETLLRGSDRIGAIGVGDGQCRAFAMLFRDSVRMHGDIRLALSEITSIAGDHGFAIYSWGHIAGQGRLAGTTHPWANRLPDAIADLEKKNNTGRWYYNWNAAPPVEFHDQPGTYGQNGEPDSQGQNGVEPKSLFTSHFLIRYDLDATTRRYYDPSYGSGPFTSVTHWEDASVVALYKLLISPAFPFEQDYAFRLNTQNDPDVREFFANYNPAP